MSDNDTRNVTPDLATRRLADLRREMPDAIVQIDSVRADDTAIAVKVTIGLTGGARHTSIAALDVDNTKSWAAQHEQVQAIAIARALDGLGMSAEQSQSDDYPPQRTSVGQQQLANQPSTDTMAPQPEPANHPVQEVSPPRPQAASQPSPGANAVQRADGDHLPEYSWTSFWQAARARSINKEQVEQALGRPIAQATPRDAVDALQAAGMWG